MKRNVIRLTLVSLTCMICACTKSEDTATVTVTTNSVTEILANSAKGGGAVTNESGNVAVTDKGLCWATTENPTVSNSKASAGKGVGEFTMDISPIDPGTTYFVRAYAVCQGRTLYGNQVSFTSTEVPVEITTSGITDITQETAVGGGKIATESMESIIEAGICWNTTGSPTITDSYTIEDLNADGSFVSELTYLSFQTTYYVRAYARVSAEMVAYGNEVRFTTLEETVVEMPDQNFSNYMLEHFDINKDGKLQSSEAEEVTEINLSALSTITNIEGVKACSNLMKLFVGTTDAALVEAGVFNTLSSVDVSGLDKLEELWLTQTGISSLDITGCTSLKVMHALKNNLTSLDLSTNTSLAECHLNENPLTGLELKNNANLRNLGIILTQIRSLDLSGNVNFSGLWAEASGLETLDFEGCTGLNEIYVNNNKISTLNVNGCTSLKQLHAVNNRLTSIDVSTNTALTDMHLNENQLESINLENNDKLLNLGLINNKLTTIDLSDRPMLLGFWVAGNPVTSIDVSGNSAMTGVYAENCTSLNSLDVSGNTALDVLFCPNCPELSEITGLSTCANLSQLKCEITGISSLSLVNHNRLFLLWAHTCKNLVSVDLSGCQLLTDVFLSVNPELVKVDVSKCAFTMNYLHLHESPKLLTIIMKKGQTVTGDFLREENAIITYVD